MAVNLWSVPTALPADFFFLRIRLRLSVAKGSTYMMNKGENTSIASTMWLMVSITSDWWGRRGGSGCESDASCSETGLS